MKLSIITINLNNAKELKKTLNSIKIQTFTDYEHIIIDGGSTDTSLEIIEQYEHKSRSSIQWLSEKDNGIYNAMNKGIKMAKGEYCFFLNSGDYLVNDKVLKTVFSGQASEDVIFGNLIITFNGKASRKAIGKEKLTFADVYAHTIKHQASFIKRELFNRFGLYNEDRKIIADWEFFIKSVGLGNASYRYVDVDIAYFDNNGISNRSAEITGKERELVINESIPTMMQADYEFLNQYRLYLPVFKSKWGFWVIRVFRKVFVNPRKSASH